MKTVAAVSSDALRDAISNVYKLAAPYTGNVNVTINKKEIVIESRAELSIVFVKVPVLVDESSIDEPVHFGVMLDQLKSAIGSRKGNISIIYENVSLKIYAKSYHSELTTVDYVDYDKPIEKDAKTTIISKVQSTWLKSVTSAVALKPSLIAPIMPVTIHIDDNGITVACYSRDHVVFVKDDSIKGSLDFSVPVEAFAAIFSCFGNSDFKLSSTSNYIKAENSLCTVYTSFPSTAAYLSIDVLLPRLNAFLNSDGIEFKISYKEALEFFTNLKAVATAERPEIIIKSNSSKTVLSCTSALGTIKYVCAGTASDISIKLDAEYFKEAISKTNKDEVIIKCCQDNGFVLIPLKNNAYSVIALNS